jgi:hypothetical protein
MACKICALGLLLLLSALPLASCLQIADAGSLDWTFQTLDSAATRASAIIVLDSHGNPCIAYVANLNKTGDPLDVRYVQYLHWNGSSWHNQTVAFGTAVLGLAIDANDNPHILYRDSGLMYASCTGSNWTTRVIDYNGRSGSLAVDSIGNAYVAYTAEDANSSILLKCVGLASGSIQIVDSIDSDYVSLALNSNDSPYIVYTKFHYISSNESTSEVCSATWAWSRWNIQSLVQNASVIKGLLDSNNCLHYLYIDAPRVYVNRTLAYASWNGSGWQTTSLGLNKMEFSGADFVLDAYDRPHVIYFLDGLEGTPNYLCYVTLDKAKWTVEVLESSNATQSGSIVLDSHGNPHIVYGGAFTFSGFSDLMYATGTEKATPPPSAPPKEPLFVDFTALVILLAIGLTGVLLILSIYRRKLIRKPGD